MSELFLDMVVIIALVIAIAYGWRLEKRLRQFEKQRQNLTLLLQKLDEAMTHAGTHINRIEQVVLQADTSLQHKIDHALTLQDELKYIVDRADKAAGQLFTQLGEGKSQTNVLTMPSTSPIDQASLPPLRQHLKNLR